MPVGDVPKWLRVLGDYVCGGVADDAHMQDCQMISWLWFGESKICPSHTDFEEGQGVLIDFDQDIWVTFSINPLTGRLGAFKGPVGR